MSDDAAKLTEKQQAFIDAIFSSECQGNLKKALKMAGYADSVRPRDVLPTVADEVRKRAKEFLAENSGTAAWALVNSLYDPDSAGTANRLKAIEAILNRAGVKEREDAGVKVPQSGLVILPAKSVTVEQEEENSDA